LKPSNNYKSILTVLQGKSVVFYVFMILLGGVNGVMTTGLLFFINSTISETKVAYLGGYDWVVFLMLLGISFVVSMAFHKRMILSTNEVLYRYAVSVLDKLRKAGYQNFERLGLEKVYTAIADTAIVGRIPEIFIGAFNAVVVISCCIVYLFTISLTGAVMIVTVMGLLLVLYLFRNGKIEGDLNRIRDLQNDFYRYMNDFLHGFKELKMSQTRNNNMFNEFILKNRTTNMHLSNRTSVKYLYNELTGSFSWYIVLGMIIFVLPAFFDVSVRQLSAFLITILYLIGPIASLITLVPTYTSIKISLERLQSFEDTVNANVTTDSVQDETEGSPAFESLRFEDVYYEYNDANGGKPFSVGPLNLSLTKGETVFIIGGNGSGKSTFINLLTGLYRPVSGNIFLNDERIDHDADNALLNQFSVVFTDNYLFSENFDGFDISDQNQLLAQGIATMKLGDKLVERPNSTFAANCLSKGQKKRLSLIYALLENRDVIVLDEWAAEQDPTFRAYFYQHVLPWFKAMNKTVIAVTHDEDYFECADRVVKFDFGTIKTPINQPA
jgi:cyclic peptide transporter